jgi:hypothetical protein
MKRREKLGRRVAFSHREYVFATRDCFEIDEVDGYDVTRKRVFYDDVVLVTRHRIVPWALIVLCSLLTLLAGLVAFGLQRELGRGFGFALFVLTLALLTLTVLLVAIGGDAVTVQGKRTQARMDFVLRRGRAIEVYRRACRLARERQQRLARQATAGSPRTEGVRS